MGEGREGENLSERLHPLFADGYYLLLHTVNAAPSNM